MDRRLFLKSLAASGAVVAVSGLPSFAEEYEGKPDGELAYFANRGAHERLSLTYSFVKIGLDKPFSVLHITDTHFTSVYPGENEIRQNLQKKRTQLFGGLQEMSFRDSVAWAKEHVDYIVHTGDFIDWQSDANFDLVKKYYGDRIAGSMGNHEFSPDLGKSLPKPTIDENYKKISREKLQSVFPFDISFQSQIINGVNFITLDDVYGYVTEEQVEKFKSEIKKGLPIVLCMHVPFITDNIWRAVNRYWVDKGPIQSAEVPPVSGDLKVQKSDKVTADFIKYLKKQKLLKAILTGHEHFSIEERFSKTAMQFVTSGNYLFAGREVVFY